ncbi:MAG TPA: dipeptide epimerase [Ktedonobacterales bacterium]|nr:dipeptide epimerase [Ktedonobacterales bacterium]
MDVRVRPLDLTLATPFRISRSVQHIAANVLVEIEHEGLTGIGEAAPSWYYGERREMVLAALPHLSERLGDDPLLIEDIIGELDNALYHGNADAKAALDMALYDLAGKTLGVPVYRLLGLNPAHTPVTSFTIGIDTPKAMAEKARAATEAGYPILKIKVGTPHDVETVRAIRDATDATLRVDANAAWTAKEAIQTINALAPYNIEFVEQPVAAGDLEGMKLVRENVPLHIIADESCITLEDIPLMVGRADGINIKLMKCGGLRNALKMIATARAHHLKVMLGCMIESSLSITAAAHISPLVDYADLDGPLLIAADPFDGVRYDSGKLVLPDRPGLGVVSREEK